MPELNDERLLGAVGRRELLLDRDDRRVLVARIQILPAAALVVAADGVRVLEDERRGLVDGGGERACRGGAFTAVDQRRRKSLRAHRSPVTRHDTAHIRITIHNARCSPLAPTTGSMNWR